MIAVATLGLLVAAGQVLALAGLLDGNGRRTESRPSIPAIPITETVPDSVNDAEPRPEADDSFAELRPGGEDAGREERADPPAPAPPRLTLEPVEAPIEVPDTALEVFEDPEDPERGELEETRSPAQVGSEPSGASAAAAELGPPPEHEDRKSGVKFLLIPAGSSTMGCTAGDSNCFSDETPAHRVTISQPFYLAATETTVGQYRKYASATGHASPPARVRFSQGDSHPVVRV